MNIMIIINLIKKSYNNKQQENGENHKNQQCVL